MIDRLRGRALQAERFKLFARAPWCVRCEAEGRQTRATIRAHRKPIEEGGTEDESNIDPLCLDCYDAKKAEELQRGVQPHGLRAAFRKTAAPRNASGHFSVRRATRLKHLVDQPPDDEAA
jgi:5-methylcytosine-specific restriction protein A